MAGRSLGTSCGCPVCVNQRKITLIRGMRTFLFVHGSLAVLPAFSSLWPHTLSHLSSLLVRAGGLLYFCEFLEPVPELLGMDPGNPAV